MYDIIITMKNSYFLHSILLFTFISFLNCTGEVNGITKTCSSNTFLCKDGVTCADEKLKCDGLKDCPDGFDEENCDTKISCSSNFFPCKDGVTCAEKKLKCDGEKDCPDGSDEENCGLGLFSNISKCGITPLADSQLDPKMVGGKNAKFGAWPWQVSIRKVWNNTHLCGGVLLNENWIVTAAHCLDYLWLSQIKIRVGEHDFSSIQEPLPFVERGVAQKVVHPEYNFYPEKYDLAMLRLNSPLEYDPHVVPICLPESDDLLVGENANVTGWGLLSQNGISPSVLQEASVTILSNDECQSMLHRAGKVNKHVTDTWLCAGSKNDSRDGCHGDSGGPLQVKGKDGRYFLAGTVSQGEGCAQSNLPGVYMRISKFVPWILKTISGHM